jgi:4'-phosphopantetheinyl transferase
VSRLRLRTPGIGEAHVWWARPADRRPWMDALLDTGERDRLARMRESADRDRFVVGAALVRSAAACYLQQAPEMIRLRRRCPDCPRPHGKMSLPDTDLEVSLSHSGSRIGLAVALMPVGIDVESRSGGSGHPVDAAAHLLSPREHAEFLSSPLPGRLGTLLGFWVRKEAALKATGDGLRLDPMSVEVSPPGSEPRLRTWPGDAPPDMALADLRPGPGHIAALAALSADAVDVRERDGSLLFATPMLRAAA